MAQTKQVTNDDGTVSDDNVMEITGEVKPDAPVSSDTNTDKNDQPELYVDEPVDDETSSEQTDESTPSVPPRLKGKSPEEIMEEFSRLESEYGRQGNELGEARALLREQLIAATNQLSQRKDDKPDDDPEITDDDLAADPVKAVRTLVKKAVKPLEEKLDQAHRSLTKSEFEARHPDYEQTAQSTKFQEWIDQSKYRQSMFKRAADFDLEAAEELFSLWEDTIGQPADADADEQDQTAKKVEKKKRLRKATTVTGGAANASKPGSRRMYKSVELSRLYIEDREAYNAMMPEIQQALKEGRVR